MKYIKSYKLFESNDKLSTIKDIVLPLEDKGFKVKFHQAGNIMNISKLYYKPKKTYGFYIDSIKDEIEMIFNYLISISDIMDPVIRIKLADGTTQLLFDDDVINLGKIGDKVIEVEIAF